MNIQKKLIQNNLIGLDYEKEKEVKRKYPLRIFELTTDFKKMINEE